MSGEILTMVEFYNRKEEFPGYEYPTISGEFLGRLSALHWATGAIIHSLWDLEDGRKVDCVLFRDKGYYGIKKMAVGDFARLVFQKADSGKVYIRELHPAIDVHTENQVCKMQS